MLALTAFFGFLHFSRGSGNGMPIASFCNGSMTTFSNTASFVPGQSVTITCSGQNTLVIWDSPQFTLEPLVLSALLGTASGTRLDGAVVFNLTNVIAGPPPCTTATATIANIQESMQGLSLSCGDGINLVTVTIDVIDPPPAVNFTAVQSFNEIVISWNNVNLPDEPCPITSYTITINGSPVTVAGNDNQYTRPITDECGSTLEISMFATSAAGPGNTTTTNLTIVAAPVDLSLCAVMKLNATSTTRRFLNAEWKIPLEEAPEVDLIIEVNSSPLSSALDASTTMYQIEDVTFRGMFDVMAYFEGQKDSMCFSTSKQITIPNEFPMVTISESTIESGKAHFILTIDGSIVTNNNLELSGGDGLCGITGPVSQLLNLSCHGLSGGKSYDLMIDMSVGGNCLVILISFNTPSLISPPTTCSPGIMMASTVPIPSTPGGASVLSSLITLLLTCMCVRGRNKKATPTCSAPLYEIPSTDTGKESLKMSPCAAYGQVQPRSTAPSSSAYEAVAL